jgi:hypothetical protein
MSGSGDGHCLPAMQDLGGDNLDMRLSDTGNGVLSRRKLDKVRWSHSSSCLLRRACQADTSDPENEVGEDTPRRKAA